LPPEWNLFGLKFLRTIVCWPPQSRAGNGSRLLNPNIIPGGALAAFMSCIEHPAWFDEQQLDLLFGIRLVLNALWNDEHFARRQMNRAIAKIDP
jgi:hypothetical protein